jgi:hypothetical protein
MSVNISPCGLLLVPLLVKRWDPVIQVLEVLMNMLRFGTRVMPGQLLQSSCIAACKKKIFWQWSVARGEYTRHLAEYRRASL